VKNQILIFLHAAKGPLIIYCTGGIEEKLEGPSNFLKPERGGFEKIQRDERKGALKRFNGLKKTLVVSFKNVSQNNLTTNKNVYRPLIFINGSQLKSLLCSCK
jgi:hypothetical protein